jgi:hypothetical protein
MAGLRDIDRVISCTPKLNPNEYLFPQPQRRNITPGECSPAANRPGTSHTTVAFAYSHGGFYAVRLDPVAKRLKRRDSETILIMAPLPQACIVFISEIVVKLGHPWASFTKGLIYHANPGEHAGPDHGKCPAIFPGGKYPPRNVYVPACTPA